jgi:hypothetical protein
MGLVLAAISFTCCVRSVVSVEEVEKMIEDQVPVGSDRYQVKKFIENLRVDSLKIGRDDFHKADAQALGNRDSEKIAELGDRIAEFAVW